MPGYRELDRAALDREYNTRLGLADVDDHLARRWEMCEAARAMYDSRRDIAYGPSADEMLDVFPSATSSSPIQIYIHGGYWRANTKEHGSFVAHSFVPAGVSVVALNHSLAPRASLDQIVAEIRRAVAWVYRNASSWGGDPTSLHVSGHSSGAHLAAMLLTPGWEGDYGIPEHVVRSACLTSGLYDLAPIRHSFVNEWLKLDDRAAERNSPILHLPQLGARLVAAVGEAESAEFQRQTADYVTAWSQAGFASEPIRMPNHHHFSMICEFGKPSSILVEAALDSMRRL